MSKNRGGTGSIQRKKRRIVGEKKKVQECWEVIRTRLGREMELQRILPINN